jgi:hypothetical protein
MIRGEPLGWVTLKWNKISISKKSFLILSEEAMEKRK